MLRALLAAPVLLRGAVAVRTEAVEVLDTEKEYDVHLLLTRHGMSCTNIVEKWIGMYDAGRRNMLDPQLGGLGHHGSRVSGATVAAWLQARNRSVDALLSSVLLRAMETGLLMYPEAGTLYVVPYIREYASGNSNSPDDQKRQVTRMKRSVPRPFHVNYRWTDLFGSQKGNWPEFLNFLEQSFLPELTQELPDRKGPVTLAVVTHSMYMKDSKDVARKCGTHWTSQREEKPLNNQVLRLAYKFSKKVPSPNSVDVTPRYSLLETAEECEQIFAGESEKYDNGKLPKVLCLGDIGEACIEEIVTHAWRSSYIWDITIEKMIVDLAIKVADMEESPKRAEKLQRLTQLKSTECWAGGTPDALRYAEFVKLQLSAKAKELAIPGWDVNAQE